MSDSATLTSSVAGRYANALFELAGEAGAYEAVEADVEALKSAISESDDLSALITSPLYNRESQGRAMAAVADAMGLGELVKGVVGIMAEKRRLFALPDVLTIYGELLADHRGQITAEVTSARPLSEGQVDSLKAAIGRATGREIRLDLSVDDALIGGLVVKVGSRMIDTSIRSKLAGLETVMKGVG